MPQLRSSPVSIDRRDTIAPPISSRALAHYSGGGSVQRYSCRRQDGPRGPHQIARRGAAEQSRCLRRPGPHYVVVTTEPDHTGAVACPAGCSPVVFIGSAKAKTMLR